MAGRRVLAPLTQVRILVPQPNKATPYQFQSDLTVDVGYNYDFLILGNLGFEPVNLTALTVMKM